MKLNNKSHGSYLIEVMVTLLIVSILLVIGVSSYLSSVHEKQVELITGDIVNKLDFAQSIAERNNTTIYATFKISANSWCLGLSNVNACDCNTTNNCQITNVTISGSSTREIVLSSNSYASDNSLSLSNFSNADNETLVISNVTGLFSETGNIIVTVSSENATIQVLSTSVNICSNTVTSYPNC